MATLRNEYQVDKNTDDSFHTDQSLRDFFETQINIKRDKNQFSTLLQHIENPMQNLLDLQSKAGNLEAQNNLFSLVKLCHNDYTA